MSASKASAPQKTFLVIDDEQAVRDVLKRYFSAKGIRVLEAATGEEGIDVVRREKLDLVLLDLQMPLMDGVTALRRLRALRPSLPVIVVTANDDQEVARRTLALGAKDYLQKPIDLDYLEQSAAWLTWLEEKE